MNIQFLLDYVIQHGYIALFLSFYVSLLGLPIPNEVIIMAGGLLTVISYLEPTYSFAIIYLTIILNATVLYLAGRFFGQRIKRRVSKYEKITTRIEHASAFHAKYGAYTASLCYFLPFLRHFIPFLLGSHRFPYPIFALYSYTTAFIWSIALFMVGRFFGKHIYRIGEIFNAVGYGLFAILVVGALILLIIRRRKNWIRAAKSE